jgi:DNA-binding transcriptional LysR family regulator
MRLESVTEQLRARYGRNSVRLHVPAYFANEMLLPRLSEFSKLHDGIDLRIETQGVHGRTHAAEADISVVVGSGPWNGALIAHPQIVRIDSMSAATRAAEKSIGIALLPAELSRRKFDSGRLVRVFEDELVTHEEYTLLVRTEDENRDDIRALCAWLMELAAPMSQSMMNKTDAHAESSRLLKQA